MRESWRGTAELRDLTSARELQDLHTLHLASESAPVRDIALITDIEEISAVGPDTVIILTHEVARGGWMVSAALRYAWERRACALIVPEQTHAGPVVELARRLGVSLFTATRDMTRLALDASTQLGVARAGSLALLQNFTERISRAADMLTALRIVSDELGGFPVRVESWGTTVLRDPGTGAAANAPASSPSGVIRVETPVSAEDGDADVLVADVAAHTEGHAQQILRAASTALRALIIGARLNSMRRSLPAASIAALMSSQHVSELDGPRLHAPEFLSGPTDEDYLVFCIMADDPGRVGGAVLHLWNEGLPAAPLARFSDGWLGFVPTPSDEDRALLIRAATARLRDMGALGLMIGASRPHRGSEEASAAIREAWLAARLATPGGTNRDVLVEFGSHSFQLLDRLLPPDLAAQLFVALLPDLARDPSVDSLVQASTAYLSHHGSVARAAHHLGIHRNTLQTRLRRAEELGISMSDPADTLPTLLLLSATQRLAP